MSEKAFQWGMRAVLVVGLAASVLVVMMTSPYYNQDPEAKNFAVIVVFYLSLAVLFTGVFSSFLFWLRKKASSKELMNVHMGVSFRQGCLLALVMVALLALQSFRVLTWWDGLLVAGAVLMVELYFLAR